MRLMYIAFIVFFRLPCGIALAAPSSTVDTNATYHIAQWIEPRLFRLGVWNIGVNRFSDGIFAMFLLGLVFLAFTAAGLGMILYRSNSLTFRPGWMLSFVVILAAMTGYANVHTYPGLSDLPTMAVFGTIAALIVLGVAAGIKTMAMGWFETGKIVPTRRDKNAVENRIRFVVRDAGKNQSFKER